MIGNTVTQTGNGPAYRCIGGTGYRALRGCDRGAVGRGQTVLEGDSGAGTIGIHRAVQGGSGGSHSRSRIGYGGGGQRQRGKGHIRAIITAVGIDC